MWAIFHDFLDPMRILMSVCLSDYVMTVTKKKSGEWSSRNWAIEKRVGTTTLFAMGRWTFTWCFFSFDGASDGDVSQEGIWCIEHCHETCTNVILLLRDMFLWNSRARSWHLSKKYTWNCHCWIQTQCVWRMRHFLIFFFAFYHINSYYKTTCFSFPDIPFENAI